MQEGNQLQEQIFKTLGLNDYFEEQEGDMENLPEFLGSKVDHILENHETIRDEFKELIPDYFEDDDDKDV